MGRIVQWATVGVTMAIGLAGMTSCAEMDRAMIVSPESSLQRRAISGETASRAPKVHCELPAAGQDFDAVSPRDVGVDEEAVRETINAIATPLTSSFRIYRHGCRIGQTVNDVHTAFTESELFSMTKSVVSLGVGRAITLGYINLDTTVGEFISEADAAHGAVTVRDLLTQTSGIRFAWANDLVGSSGDSLDQVLSMPMVAESGTEFDYAQTTVTMLAILVERAAGQDFQDFMSEQLFEPVGIERSDWTWLRDAAGHTQGYAWLGMRPVDMARLGMLVLGGGAWNGTELIDASYIDLMGTPTSANPGYGLLTTTNRGAWFLQSFGGKRYDRHRIGSAPADTVMFSGFLDQMMFMVPSLDLVIVRFGLPPEPLWTHHLFESLLAGIPGAVAVDPGKAPQPPAITFDIEQLIDVGELIRQSQPDSGI